LAVITLAPVVVETGAGMDVVPVEVCTTGVTLMGAYGLAVGVGVGLAVTICAFCDMQYNYIFSKAFK